jgi:hypothetical protein
MGAIAPLGWAGAIGSVLILLGGLSGAMMLCRMALRSERCVEIEIKLLAFTLRVKTLGAETSRDTASADRSGRYIRLE